MKFCKLTDLKSINFKVFSDASFNNLSGGGSQGGFLIFICDKKNNAIPIYWQSNRLKRVVKSTLAAETLAFSDAAESCFWLKTIFEELIPNACCKLDCFTDNKSLSQSVYSTTLMRDKRLQVDIAAIREMISKMEINSVKWVSSDAQLADCLTKEGADSEKLVQAVCAGNIDTPN